MELEFDKEIDALLRKARSGTGAATPVGDHLDADAISAFAEGAVPDVLRKTYTAHFADCDRCRKALSHVALLGEPTAIRSMAAAAAPQAAPWPPNAVPWYRSLFRTPGLATAMGVLVVLFGGVLVYLVMNRANISSTSSIAMDSNKANASAIPYSGIDSNSTANAPAPAANTSSAANSTTSASKSSSNVSNTAVTTSSNGPAGSAAASRGTSAAGTGTAGGMAPPTVAAPAPAGLPINGRNVADLAEDKPKTSTEERKDADDEKEAARDRAATDRLARGEVTTKSTGGPLRNAGPAQSQVQNNVSGDIPVTRRAGGKSFHNANGAWYDNAYHGQATTNVRRGTDEFKKLDSGLRAIANELGGVVVVVWKSKAYRIQ